MVRVVNCLWATVGPLPLSRRRWLLQERHPDRTVDKSPEKFLLTSGRIWSKEHGMRVIECVCVYVCVCLCLRLCPFNGYETFPFSALSLSVWRQERHQACKNWVLVCWWWHFDWSFNILQSTNIITYPAYYDKMQRLIAPVVTTTSVILSCNRILNGEIRVLAYPGPN